MPYLDKLHQAIRLSDELGFSTEKFQSTSKRYLTDEVQQQLHNWLLSVVGPEMDAHKLICQCIGNHLNAINFIRNLLGITPLFTVGYVTIGDEKYHEFSEDDLRGWLITSLPDPARFSGHAWLTLPSLEIIDFTFLATYAFVQYQKTGENIGMGVLARHADDVQGLTYIPVAAGSDIPEKIGALSVGLLVLPS